MTGREFGAIFAAVMHKSDVKVGTGMLPDLKGDNHDGHGLAGKGSGRPVVRAIDVQLIAAETVRSE